MEIHSLLKNVQKSDLRLEPFPHIVVENALPREAVEELIRTFPSNEIILDGKEPGDNKRFDYTIKQLREKGGVDTVWQQFLEAQAGPEFWADFCRIFGDEVRSRYPHLEERYGPLKNMKRGIRYIDSHATADIVLDSHLSINTPCIKKPTRVRGAHVDDPLKLYGALYYLRTPDDDSTGGDLVLYTFKGEKRPFFGQQIRDEYVSEFATTPYKANTLILFLNTDHSLHGVTERSVTQHTRRFVNLVGELSTPLFNLQGMQESIWIRRLRTYGGSWLQKGFDNR